MHYQPKPITTEAENDRAISLAQELEHRPARSLEEETFLELLVTLIEKFEADHYPIPIGTPISMLQHLMDARDLSAVDLIPIFGTPDIVARVLSEQRAISREEASQLSRLLGVDPQLFLVPELFGAA